MASNGSEFPQSLNFIFHILSSWSSQKIIARMIRQWFWCKYFACTFILYFKCSRKNYRLPTLYLNTAAYSLWVPGMVCLCCGGRFCLCCHTLSQSILFSAQWQCCLKIEQVANHDKYWNLIMFKVCLHESNESYSPHSHLAGLLCLLVPYSKFISLSLPCCFLYSWPWTCPCVGPCHTNSIYFQDVSLGGFTPGREC